MQPNPALLKLGFAASDRVVIIHTDDIGMCQASVTAYDELAAFGLISSAAVMVPCGWFSAAAAASRAHPERDLGIHLTITSEWDVYRWGPISTNAPESGLLDAEGYFHRTTAAARAHGQPAAVAHELAAQVERALAAGIRPTHVDTHMLALYSPAFLPVYLDIARRFRLPPMFFRLDEADWRARGIDAEFAAANARLAQELEADGIPLVDNMVALSLEDHADREGQARRAFDGLPPGLTHLIIHPSHDTPELRAIAKDWRCRVADYQTFLSEELRAYVRASGVQVIGYRALQELIPSA